MSTDADAIVRAAFAKYAPHLEVQQIEFVSDIIDGQSASRLDVIYRVPAIDRRSVVGVRYLPDEEFSFVAQDAAEGAREHAVYLTKTANPA